VLVDLRVTEIVLVEYVFLFVVLFFVILGLSITLLLVLGLHLGLRHVQLLTFDFSQGCGRIEPPVFLL